MTTKTPPLAGLVLAGGRGERLGRGDKGLLLLEGEPFVAHVARALRPLVTALAVSANRLEEQYRPWVDKVLPDARFPEQGPLAGLYEGLNWAAEQGCAGVLVAACDAPRIPAAWAQRMADCARHSPELPHLTRLSTGIQPLHGYYPVSCRQYIATALEAGDRRVRHLVTQLPVLWCDCDDFAEDFLNINHPEDFNRLTNPKKPPS